MMSEGVDIHSKLSETKLSTVCGPKYIFRTQRSTRACIVRPAISLTKKVSDMVSDSI